MEKKSVSAILVQKNLSLDFVIKCVHDYICITVGYIKLTPIQYNYQYL